MFRASGRAGRLLAVYSDAARLEAWSFATGETLGATTSITAVVCWQHPVLIRHRPLIVSLRIEDSDWRWEARELVIERGELHASAHGAPIVIPWRMKE